MNSTLGSVVPLAMFYSLIDVLRQNRLFCSISHRISFTQKRSISALIPTGFPSAKMSISGLVLIGCRERSLEPHQCSSPICTILLLFIHTLYTLLFFKPIIKLWWTIIIEPPHCWGFSAVIRIIFANPAGRPKGFWRMELDQEDIRVHTNKNSHRVKIPREWGNVLTAAKEENC